ncbi:MAG TPA: iron-sulfur cluster assembly protein [Verrucomicrobiae bacterium]|nr:iron-sulfur cluster assembly protein [Verrucomicrobiae bacterium]
MTGTKIDEAAVLETLRQIIDPEIGVNIVDLGLIYGVSIADGMVRVKMTLTTPGCPMHDSISGGVKNTLLELEGVTEAEVEIVFEPPWHLSLMSEQARIALRVGNF